MATSIRIIPRQTRFGVAGAGTMGSGIALTALMLNFQVVLFDISADMLSNARQYIEYHLNRKQKAISIQYLELTTELDHLANCGIVIEAISEDIERKRKLFNRLDELCSPDTIFTTNTSTLSVTEIAASVHAPERVAGMHFFNPAPVMPLVEVIKTEHTSPATLQAIVDLVILLGKTPVVASDNPGFIVNRVARPFYGEALRLLGEKSTSHDQIDRLIRDGGGFPMGPFQLMDLIGLDVNLAATRSVFEQTFFEPRYRPHLIQVRMVNQKALGRKTGRGFYRYDNSRHETSQEITSVKPPTIPDAPPDASGKESIWLSSGSWVPGILEVCQQNGVGVNDGGRGLSIEVGVSMRIALVRAGRDEEMKSILQSLDNSLPDDSPIICQCVDTTLSEIASWLKGSRRIIGFDGLFFHYSSLVTLVTHQSQSVEFRDAVEVFFNRLGYLAVWVEDTPGLILPRVIAMLVNEAAFAVGEGVSEPAVIDKAMRLGMNFPCGPLEWGAQIGYAKITAILDHLHREYGEDRYRVAPALRRWSRQPDASNYFNLR